MMRITTNSPVSITELYERQITRAVADKSKHMADHEFSRILGRERNWVLDTRG